MNRYSNFFLASRLVVFVLLAASSALLNAAFAQTSSSYCGRSSDCIRNERAYQSALRDISDRYKNNSRLAASNNYMNWYSQQRRDTYQPPRYQELTTRRYQPSSSSGSGGGSNSSGNFGSAPTPAPAPAPVFPDHVKWWSLSGPEFASIANDFLSGKNVPLQQAEIRKNFSYYAFAISFLDRFKVMAERPLTATPAEHAGSWLRLDQSAENAAAQPLYIRVHPQAISAQLPLHARMAASPQTQQALATFNNTWEDNDPRFTGWRLDTCEVDPSALCVFRVFPAFDTSDVTRIANYLHQGHMNDLTTRVNAMVRDAASPLKFEQK